VGYVAADLAALVKEGVWELLRERRREGGREGGREGMVVGERHLRAAMERVGASVLRGHGVEVGREGGREGGRQGGREGGREGEEKERRR